MNNALPAAPPATLSPNRRRAPRQLDFALPARPGPSPVKVSVRRPRAEVARPCRRERAQWWFEQMRQIVAEGRDFNAAGVF